MSSWGGFTLAFLVATVGALASPVQFDTHSYNFALDGGGGGESGVLNLTQDVETVCVDFDNEIYVGHTDYSAYLSTLTAGSDLSHTRFGGNSSWHTITLNDGDPNDAADSATIDDADALERYQMAAFLVTEYQMNQGSNAYNNGIQGAIWDILDPSSSPLAPDYANADQALERAAEWLANPNADKSFLAGFLIVSDATMAWNGAGKPLAGGFQEQLTMLTTVPEPRQVGWILMALFSICAFLQRTVFCMEGRKF